MPNPAQTKATLMVDKTTGAIIGPVSAATFKSGNGVGGGAPDAHAASHAAAGADPVTLAQSQITNLTTDLAAKATAAALTSHTGSTSNPHSVTKAQVGLTNADDTSDAAKPVSTAQQTALDLKVTANAGITGATKTKVTYDAKGLVTAGDDATTADITDSTNKRYVTDAQQTIIGNTSGVNTGDSASDPAGSAAAAQAAAIQRVNHTGTQAIATVDGLQTALDSIQPSPTGNQLISGGGVSLVSNLTVEVTAATYTIQGAPHASPQAQLTAGTADATNPRIDVVAVNTSNVAVLIAGTPAATPVKPDVDPTTQLEITFFVVAAGATALTINVVDVYRENTEYTMSENGTSIVLDSTNNPHLGTVTIEATSAGAGDYFQAEAGAPIDLGQYDSLIFFLRNKAAWHSSKQLTLTARSSGVQVGSAIAFKHGLFGFDQTNTTTYQQIVIPASLFAANGQSVNQLRWAVAGGGSAIGWYIDDITLQGGLAPVVDATRLKWRGVWSADVMYNINDASKADGVPYVSLQPGMNHPPASSPTYWMAMSDAVPGGGGTLTLCRWTALDNQPPAANFATRDTRNSIAVLDFDDTTAESAVFAGVVPEGADFTTGITVRLIFTATASGASGEVIFTSAFERGNTDLDADSFATGVDSAPTLPNATIGIPETISINHSGSEIDGITAGDLFRLKITRKAADAGDDMGFDAEIIAVEIQQR